MSESFSLQFAPCLPDADAPTFASVPWDSRLFGFPFYELRCGEVHPSQLADELSGWLAQLSPEKPCLVYTRIAPLNVALSEALASCGFYHVETTIDLAFGLSEVRLESEWQTDKLVLGAADSGDLEEVKSLARSAFTTDRFHLDPHLPSELADQRYVNWIENAYAAGEMLFTYKDRKSGKLIGFYHVRELGPGHVDLSLAGIDPAYQHFGIGPMMYRDVFRACVDRGYERASTRVALQNTDVINLYLGFGVQIGNAQNTLHCFRP